MPRLAFRHQSPFHANVVFILIPDVNTMQRRMLKRLQEVREGTTMCPGRLARDCGSTLAVVRPDLLALARAKKIVLSQAGQPVSGEKIKGPFRVRLR